MTTRFCKICFEEIKINNLHNLLFKDICICDKCLTNLNPVFMSGKIDGVKGYYLYTYNSFVKEKIFTFKGCGDIELGQTFLNYWRSQIRLKFRNYSIVCAPSNDNENEKREFNHVEEIYKVLKLPILPCLKKGESFKQSDLSKEERQKVINKILLTNPHLIRNKNILFVDDISTTGSTLSACLKLIKKAIPKKLSFLVIAKVLLKN